MATVKIKYSNTAGAVPSLVSGEIGINQKDGLLYWRSDLGVIKSKSLNPESGGSGGAASILIHSVLFNDGDTFKRVRVNNASISTTSKIIITVNRPDVAEADDIGYVYGVNVVQKGAGFFDVVISCTAWGFEDAVLVPPNETIFLHYLIG